MNVSAEYQLTFEEFKEGSLSTSKHGWNRTVRRLFFYVFFIGLWIEFARLGKWILVSWIGILVALWYAGKDTLRTKWAASPRSNVPRTLHIDDAGITISTSTASFRELWAHFIRMEETASLILLYVDEKSAEFIPKRIFTNQSDLDSFRNLVRGQFSAPTRAFPVAAVSSSKAESTQNELH